MASEIGGYAPGHWSQKAPDGGTFYEKDTYSTVCVDVGSNGRERPSPRKCDGWKEHADLTTTSLDALINAGRVWSTPVADGYAHYYIVSEDPLTLISINYMDAYRAHPAMIRGLTLDDVEAERRFRQRWQPSR